MHRRNAIRLCIQNLYFFYFIFVSRNNILIPSTVPKRQNAARQLSSVTIALYKPNRKLDVKAVIPSSMSILSSFFNIQAFRVPFFLLPVS